MAGERMTVEVVCESSHAEYTDLGSRWCIAQACNGSGVLKARVAPGSLTAARLRLADAVDRADHFTRAYATRLLADHPDGKDTATEAQRAERVAMMGEWDAADAAKSAALAALRAHPDYTVPTRGDG